MADLRALLAQLLGGGEQTDNPAFTRAPAPGQGFAGRGRPDLTALPLPRPMPARPAPVRGRNQMGPMTWGQTPEGGWELVPVSPPPMRVRPLPAEHPGNYTNFADFANATSGRRSPDAPPAADREPWRQGETPQIGELVTPLPVGAAAPQRGLEPPSAPAGPSEAALEDQAWNEAVARVRAQRLGADPTGLRVEATRELQDERGRHSQRQVAADMRLGAQDLYMRARGIRPSTGRR